MPDVLPTDELCHLITLAQAGDIEARNRVWLANLGLVHLVARRMPGVESYDETVSCGCLGLLAAIETYDPSIAMFSTWAAWKIRVEILNSRKRERRWSDRWIPLAQAEEVFDEAAGEGLSGMVDREEWSDVESVLSRWSADDEKAKYAEILACHFGLGGRERMNNIEIGLMYGLSRERIRVLSDRGWRWLCAELGVETTRSCSGGERLRRQGKRRKGRKARCSY